MDSSGTNQSDNPEFEKKHPLHTNWSLWFDRADKKVNANQWRDCIKKVKTVDTVEDFWCLFNNIPTPSKLSMGSNFHFFREGIEPSWEDKANEGGGKWVVSLPRPRRDDIMDECWTNLLLSLIGENFEDGELICGAVISLRKQNDRISLWTNNGPHSEPQREIQERIGRHLRAVMRVPPTEVLTYQIHSDSKRRNSSYGNPHCYTV
eukprot:Rmarinus@m.16315